MNDSHRNDLMARYLSGFASPAETAELEEELTRHPAARRIFLRHAHLDAALLPCLAAVPVDPMPSRHRPPRWRPGTAAAAGLALGLLTASVVWGFVSPSPRAASSQVAALHHGSFEPPAPAVGRGFPRTPSTWSGDPAEIVPGPGPDHGHMLKFIEPAPDASTPDGRALSCDVFQIVDLRPLVQQIPPGHEATLELSAAMHDARPSRMPSLTFLCQIFLFSGSPETMHQQWPHANRGALASSARLVDSAGLQPAGWQTLSTRCLFPRDATFAVMQIGARRNGSHHGPLRAFADHVSLKLRTQPILPVKP